MAKEPKAVTGASDVVTPAQTDDGEAILNDGHLLAGNFLIQGILGEGGMAIVYKALQKSLNRTVAIKVLHSRFARDREFISRFEMEAGALASLTHPNIVNIIDRGSDGHRYFFIMEFVDGETLDTKIVENRLSFELWRNVVQACRDSLDYVHSRGVVHRDIKPSNILIGKDGRVRLSDFGIAHILGGDEGEAAHITKPSRAVGTANYMAPEQTSDPRTVDHRADVYSLGVTYYKMLTRALPVGDFQSPSEANHDVPVAVDEVIFRAMCPDRDDRYQTVKEFCDDLLKALREQSVSITSVLDYRRGNNQGSALYTGADFRSSSSSTSVPREKPEPEKKERERKKTTSQVDDSDSDNPALQSTSALLARFSRTPSPMGEESTTPPPTAKKKTEPRKETTHGAPRAASGSREVKLPAKGTADPVAKTSPSPAPPPPSSNSSLKFVAITASIAAVALLIVVVVLMMKKPPQQTSIPGQIPTSVTEEQDRIRQQILKDKNLLPPESGATAEATPAATGS